MTGRHDLPEIEAMLIADRTHGEQLGNADDAKLGYFAADPLPTRRDCSWCGGTGRRPKWIGWTKVDDEPCCRCGGHGSIVVEAGCHD